MIDEWSPTPALVERLGHPVGSKLVIISCDDLGSCHAANEGVYGALRDGVATCASIMVPAPWARDAAIKYRPGDDIGVHLTLNCEFDAYRFGPITHAPSLQSGEAGFPRDVDDLWEHADPEEVLRECRAQIERALAWDIDVTHLAPHLSAITLRPEFFDVYLELAVEFRLPIRLPSTITADQAGFPFRRLAGEAGVLFPDHFDHDWRAGSRDRVYHAIAELEAGRHRDPRAAGDRHPRGAGDQRPRRGVDRRLPADDRRRTAHQAARRQRRRAHRLPRPQGRDAATRLSATPASPLRSRSSSGPVGPVLFSLPRM